MIAGRYPNFIQFWSLKETGKMHCFLDWSPVKDRALPLKGQGLTRGCRNTGDLAWENHLWISRNARFSFARLGYQRVNKNLVTRSAWKESAMQSLRKCWSAEWLGSTVWDIWESANMFHGRAGLSPTGFAWFRMGWVLSRQPSCQFIHIGGMV